jgi:hypothetical protein
MDEAVRQLELVDVTEDGRKNGDANLFSPERFSLDRRPPCEKKVCVPIFPDSVEEIADG